MLNTMTRQFEGALKQGKDMTLGFAKQVERAKGPVETLEKRGLAVNEVAHHYLARAIRQQFVLIDAAIEESSKRLRAIAKAGSDVGVPLIVLDGGKGAGFFGPVMSPAPTGKRAVEFWDAIISAGGTPGFFELKRTREIGPLFGERPEI